MSHLHHKIPKHMGGSNEEDNLAELSIKEHSSEEFKKVQSEAMKKHGLVKKEAPVNGRSINSEPILFSSALMVGGPAVNGLLSSSILEGRATSKDN